MTNRVAHQLTAGKKLLLAAMGLAAVIAPILIGIAQAAPVRIPPQAQEGDPLVPEYQVISLKPNKTGNTIDTWMLYRPNGFTATNVPLRGLICEAYGVQDSQISGGPDWVNSEKYDLKAREDHLVEEAAGKPTVGRQRLMLQHLLSDQFKLSLHHETRDLPAYELVVAKDGPKLIEANPGGTSLTSNKDFYSANGRLTGEAVSLAELVETLSRLLGQPVLDKTGLKGKYDFSLDSFAPLRAPESAPSLLKAASEHAEALAKVHAIETASILMAVSEQLGLELNPQLSPVDTLVIDHAEHVTGDEPSVPRAHTHETGVAAPMHEVASIKPNKTTNPMGAMKAKPNAVSNFTEDGPHAMQNQAERQDQNAAANGPEFEVASIRSNKSGSDQSRLIFLPDGIGAMNVTLQMLIRAAYGVQDYQISGAPSWLSSEKYDVEAKMDGSAADELRKLSVDQRNLKRRRMLRFLLADRLKLSLHSETKELPVYALVVADNGPKLHEAEPDYMRIGRGQLTSQGVRIGTLARELSRQLSRPVLDRTRLAGYYEFTLKWAPDESQTLLGFDGTIVPDTALPTDSFGPSVFAAVQEQLGLKLESQKGPVEILVIDRAEKPSEN